MATIVISDTFNRIVADGLGDADGGADTSKTWAFVNKGTVSVNGTVASMTSPVNLKMLSVVGDSHEGDVEVKVQVTNLPGGGKTPGCGLVLRFTSASAYYSVGYNEDDGVLVAYKAAVELDSYPLAYASAFTLKVKAHTNVDDSVDLTFKYWTSGGEPAEWTTLTTDGADAFLTGSSGILTRGVCSYDNFEAQVEVPATTTTTTSSSTTSSSTTSSSTTSSSTTSSITTTEVPSVDLELVLDRAIIDAWRRRPALDARFTYPVLDAPPRSTTSRRAR